MTKLGAALIGCGSISGVHLKAFAQVEQAELKVVVDTNEEAAKQAAAAYNCEYLTDYRDLFTRDDVQVVHLCTPHYLHAPMAAELLAAGKHVLTEKPMAESWNSAKSLLNAAAEHPNVQLGVIFQNRYNPSSQLMKQYVDSGELGKLQAMRGIVTWSRGAGYYKTEWKGKWSTEGGGVLINQTIHTLDLIQWLGGEIATVKGTISNDTLEGVIEVEDTAHACIEFKNGVRAVFYGTNAHKFNSPVELELVFEKGALSMRGDYLYVRQNGEERVLSEPVPNELGEKSYWGASHVFQIRDFYEHVAAGKPFWIDGPEGVKAAKVVFDIYESSKTGKAIEFRV